MSDTSDTGTNPRDSGETGDTGDSGDTGGTGGGTVEAGPPEEVILVEGGRSIDVTDDPDDAFPPGSQVPDQSPSTAGSSGGRRPVVAGHQLDPAVVTSRTRLRRP
jgi:hypothetical protein